MRREAFTYGKIAALTRSDVIWKTLPINEKISSLGTDSARTAVYAIIARGWPRNAQFGVIMFLLLLDQGVGIFYNPRLLFKLSLMTSSRKDGEKGILPETLLLKSLSF